MIDDVVERFLRATIANGLKQRFYRLLWAEIDVARIQTPADLSVLPCVTKEMYRNDYMDHFDHRHSHFLSHSTGTTGPLTFRHRSRLEAEIVSLLLTPTEVAPVPRVGIVLEAASARAYHGSPMPVPESTVSIPAGTRNEIQLRQCVEMLTASFRLHGRELRPSYLQGRATDVALVAHALRMHGVDPTRLALDEVTTMAVVDEGLRQFLRRSLAVPVQERFSCSEIFGGAVRMDGQDFFVTDPFVIAEVSDESGHSVGDGAVGRLTMTELYPFVQIQPLIRYLTGDVVERVGSPAPGQIAFRWLGRIDQCVTLQTAAEASFIAYRPLIDALGQLPAVARRDVYPDSNVRFGGVGIPRVEISKVSESEVLVRVGMSVSPFFYPNPAQEVIDTSWAAIHAMGAAGDIAITVELFAGYPAHGTVAAGKETVLRLGPSPLSDAAPRLV
jgi:phenylacetate-coenzyme A ligase PaaK-like adenylate-forming protein